MTAAVVILAFITVALFAIFFAICALVNVMTLKLKVEQRVLMINEMNHDFISKMPPPARLPVPMPVYMCVPPVTGRES